MQPRVKARSQDRPTTMRGTTLVNSVCCTTVSVKLAAGLVLSVLVLAGLVWSARGWVRVRPWSCARARVCSHQPLRKEMRLPNGTTYTIENRVLASQAPAQTHGQQIKNPHVTRISRWLLQRSHGGRGRTGPEPSRTEACVLKQSHDGMPS